MHERGSPSRRTVDLAQALARRGGEGTASEHYGGDDPRMWERVEATRRVVAGGDGGGWIREGWWCCCAVELESKALTSNPAAGEMHVVRATALQMDTAEITAVAIDSCVQVLGRVVVLIITFVRFKCYLNHFLLHCNLCKPSITLAVGMTS